MVRLVVKSHDKVQFVHEVSATTPVRDLIQTLVDFQNLRKRAERLVHAGRDLLAYGIMKPMTEHGYTPEHMEQLAKGEPKDPNQDPTGRRNGKPPKGPAAETLQNTLDALMVLCQSAHTNAMGGDPLPFQSKSFHDQIALVQGACVMAFPGGLPEYEPVQIILDDAEDLSGTAAAKEFLELETTTLWWASKELQPDKLVKDYVGANEKTKIVVKLQKRGQGAPVREPALDEATQKALMAHYYKKQEEDKRLKENNEDDYLNSVWADPKALKKHFQNVSNVSWRP